MNSTNENRIIRYHKKYKHMKKRIKSLIIENAALCDEVAKIQENILIVKDERKFLLRKLLELENESETQQSRFESITHNGSKAKPKKRRSLEDGGKNISSALS
ncbi:PREDICTED: transforming growth factor beta regulator 1 [Papilio polytes]|uniref:transforming growth factor beta regulator 1 n=1 Tax=Papilio polytes TaxID=76194 RepID=UPI000675BF7E|nr:PREDICTED: transforming growth factor beta regulator 1 [Papilio polytes]